MGRVIVIHAIPARRLQRSAKLCAFHVKNHTGRIAPSSSKEPSTRQNVGGRDAVSPVTRFELVAGSVIRRKRPLSGSCYKVKHTCVERLNNDSHPRPFYSGSNAKRPPASTPMGVPRPGGRRPPKKV